MSRPSSSSEFLSPVARLAGLRGRLAALREQARERYAAGMRGIHILAGIASATEELILQLYREALHGQPDSVRRQLENEMALVAVGGTGRGELAPYSDVDLLFLHTRAVGDLIQPCIAQMVRDCWDVGLKLGHSVRTIDDALAMAAREPQFATALIEARRVDGDERVVDRLQRQFSSRLIRRRQGAFIEECITARSAEFQEFGGAVQQLEPDLKRSPGGLRDLHLIRWVGFARFGTPDFDLLRMQGALTREDVQTLLTAQEYLSRLRINLHLAAGKPQDVLTRDEQLRIAREWAVEGTAGQSPVERFMQQYFQHSTAIAHIARRFLSLQRPRSLASRVSRFLMTHRANGVFKVSPDEIDARLRERERIANDLDRTLRLYELAGLYGVTPAPQFEEIIKRAASSLPAAVGPESARVFLSILRCGRSLGPLLRSMFETGILEKVLPEFAHVRCLLQFNQYHSYTVDEHSLQAVEAVTAFEQDTGSLGDAYRAVHHKDILHLALLLHDAGKGYEEDHSEVGRRIAETVADRLQLPGHLREMLVFLVHKHLMMAHLAFRRNASDPEVYVPFSREVGSAEILRMLYVLTAADITAVGPGVWTNWKAELLDELYQRSLQVLNGEPSEYHESERLRGIRQEVRALLLTQTPSLAEEWIDQRLDTLPGKYLTATPPEQVAAALRAIHDLEPEQVLVHSEYDQQMNTVEYRIITRAPVGSGCFSKMAGVLTAKRLEILSAQINTTTDGIVLDSFRVIDFDFAGEIPPDRLEDVAQAIQDVLSGRRDVASLFRNQRRFGPRAPQPVSDLPTRIVIDNDSSDRYTIIDVFAHDRTGLLYTIADTIHELGLSVELAKISTHLDQVVDVFYVTDHEGCKIHKGSRLEEIRDSLSRRIEEFKQSGL